MARVLLSGRISLPFQLAMRTAFMPERMINQRQFFRAFFNFVFNLDALAQHFSQLRSPFGTMSKQVCQTLQTTKFESLLVLVRLCHPFI